MKKDVVGFPHLSKIHFWAGMSTTQRSESMNAFFDGYVNSKTKLKQFVEQYDSALRDKIGKGNQVDFQSFSTLIPCVTHFVIKKRFQAVSTNAKFKKFQKELTEKIYCEVSCVDESSGLFDVCEVLFFGEGSKEVHLTIHFNKENNEVQCSCQLFEFKGILCKHAISILIRMGVSNVPMKYILSRWSKNLRRCHTKIKLVYDDLHNNPEAQRYHEFQRKFDKAVD
ncbi:protein FAR1-RELATED SEQUENCE 5-like [Humulus lupulus]|uniref:protein FAR1-RELATED SEQUENCE 5-like n=1 Tax=Humulus lupulus TaxID=3486 RepID=UPI002B409476|nr:protein FAR1-RELATED SEQUENCE 5-like [Humulus lupulus]